MIDSHIHFVAPDGPEYPWQPVPHDAFGPNSPHVVDWWVGQPFDGQHVLDLIGSVGIGRAVAVQPFSVYRYDSSYAIDLAREFPGRITTIVALDGSAPDAADELARVAALPGVAGARLMASGTTREWVGDPRIADIFATAAETDMTIALAGQPEDIVDLRPLFERFDSVRFVVDHCAHPAFIPGTATMAKDAPLLSVVPFPNVHVKYSNLTVRRTLQFGPPRDLLAQVVDAFGIDRLVWGSDYPHTTGDGYPAQFEQILAITDMMDDHERRAFFEGNAERLYRFDHGESSATS